MHCGGVRGSVGVVLGWQMRKNGVLFVFLAFFLSFWLSNEMTKQPTPGGRRVEVTSGRKRITLVFCLLRLMFLLLRCLCCMVLCVWVGVISNLYLYHRRDKCSHGDISGFFRSCFMCSDIFTIYIFQ